MKKLILIFVVFFLFGCDEPVEVKITEEQFKTQSLLEALKIDINKVVNKRYIYQNNAPVTCGGFNFVYDTNSDNYQQRLDFTCDHQEIFNNYLSRTGSRFSVGLPANEKTLIENEAAYNMLFKIALDAVVRHVDKFCSYTLCEIVDL